MKSLGRLGLNVSTALGVFALCASAYAAGSTLWLLVPGKQAGSLRLQSYPKGLPLGKPDYEDAGMSHYVDLWASTERDKAGMPLNTVVAASTSNGPISGGPGVTLTNVRITSPKFHDAHGLSTGSTLAVIRRFYAHLAAVDGKPAVLADDPRGIAFEFGSARPKPSSRCVAIDIYEPGGYVKFDAVDVREMVEEWKKEPTH